MGVTRNGPSASTFCRQYIRFNKKFRKCTLFCYTQARQALTQTSNIISRRQQVCVAQAGTPECNNKTTFQPFPNQETVVLRQLSLRWKCSTQGRGWLAGVLLLVTCGVSGAIILYGWLLICCSLHRLHCYGEPQCHRQQNTIIQKMWLLVGVDNVSTNNSHAVWFLQVLRPDHTLEEALVSNGKVLTNLLYRQVRDPPNGKASFQLMVKLAIVW